MNIREQFDQAFKRPQTILLLITLIGILLLVIFYIYGLLPKQQEVETQEMRLQQEQMRLMQIQRLTPQEEIEADIIKEALKEVPLRTGAESMLRSLLDIERATGVNISSITNYEGPVSEKADVLTEYLASLNAARPSGEIITREEMELQEKTEASLRLGGIAEIKSTFVHQELELALSGSYEQIYQFIDKLFNYDRLLILTDWSLSPDALGENVSANMIVSYFAAPAHASLFDEYAPVTQVESNGSRHNPMTSVWDFYQQISGEDNRLVE